MALRARIVVVVILATLAALPVANITASPVANINHPDAGPPGIYVFYDWSKVNPKTYPVIGGQMIFTWKSIETSAGKYNWGNVDKFIADMASQGKRAGLRINSYDGQCCGGSSVPDFYKSSTPNIVIKCNGIEIPRYWDNAYKNNFGKLINAFGARYNKDSRVAWVEISTGIFGETAPAEDDYDACLQSGGLSSELWVSTVNWATDLYRGAFPNKQLFLQYAPRYLSRIERRQFSDYAAGKGVGLKHNGLKPDGGGDAFITDPTNDAYQAGQYDPLVIWGDQVTLAFEGSESSVSMEGRTNSMWAIYNALDKRTDFLVLDTAVTTAADRQDLLQFAVKYLGKRLPDIPSAWVALRETEYDWFPDYGNYEFYLYQNDAAPGGKTTPLWKVNSTAEGRYSRRTDQASGNPNMYFDLDDNYAYESIYKATFSVTYLDKGTDKWELRYDATTDPDKLAGTVTKTNTGKWLTAAFDVTDARFGNRQPGGGAHPGSDFRIFSLNDGNETIHKVDVVAAPGKPKTLRVQPGVEGYDGLRDAYLTSWYPDKNTGAETQFWVGSPEKMYGMLRFDLSALPQGARVVTATLGVYQSGNALSYATELALDAYRLLRAWDEGATTWHQATNAVSWQQPGATGANDREAVAGGSTTTNQLTGWAEIDVTSMAQAWSDTPGANYGVWLKGTSGPKAQFYFYSREYREPALRPWLQIDYYDPVKPPSSPTPSSTPSKTPTPKPTTATPSATASATPTATYTASPTPTLVARTLISRRAPLPPTIDGNLGEWTQPELAQVKTGSADTITFQPNPAVSDLSADVRSFWDEQFLYLVASVNDDKPYTDSDQVWDDDSVEFGIDGLNDQAPSQADDHQFTVTLDGRLADGGTLLSPAMLAAFKVAARQRSGGYDVELAIPRDYLAAGALSDGKLLGFTIGLNDDDDGGKREGTNDNHMVWEGASTNSAPGDYGKLFLGAPFGPDVTATPSLTPSPTASRTPTLSPSATPSPSVTPSPTVMPSPTITPSLTPTGTATSTAVQTGRVSGRVWMDRDGDGRVDPNEPGVAGIGLTLAPQSGANGEEQVTFSLGNGAFEFMGVAKGWHALTIMDLPNLQFTTDKRVMVEISDVTMKASATFGIRPRPNGKLYLPAIRRE